MILAVPFLLVFIAGLAAAVYSMLQGVTAASTAGAATRIGMISAPSVAAFAVAFGAIGYLCTKYTGLGHPAVLIIALAGGSATIPLSVPLLARLSRNRPPLEGEIEGQLAKVVQPMTESASGEIVYERDGKSFHQRARNVIGGPLAAGRDVVIDRIEDGVAYVEDWESVEKRL